MFWLCFSKRKRTNNADNNADNDRLPIYLKLKEEGKTNLEILEYFLST